MRKSTFDLKNFDGPILITGHSGFKGSWLTFLLEELGLSVVGLSLPPLQDSLFQRANRLGRIPEVFGDIRDLTFIQETFKKFQPTCVIHMAAQPLVIDSYLYPINTFDINVLGTANLLEVATLTESVKTIACITTDKVYRNTNANDRFLESDVLQGKDPYSASKVAMESVIDAWRNLAQSRNGANLMTLRSGNVIGGGDYSNNRLMPDVIRSIFSEEPLLIRNPDATRPWQHVLDPLFGYLMAIDYSMDNNKGYFDTFNFGPSEQSLSVREVIRLITHYYPKFERTNFEENSKEHYEAEFLQLDSTRANSVLGWQPKLDQTQAIISTIKWWVDNIEKGISAETLCKNEIKRFFQ